MRFWPLTSPGATVAIRHWAGYARPEGGVQVGRVFAQVALPVAAGAAVWFTQPQIGSTAIGLVLGATAILTGLLFQLLLSVLTMIQRLHDQILVNAIGNRSSTAAFYNYLKQLDADISYTVAVGVVLVSSLTAALFVESNHETLRQVGITGLAVVIAHFAFSLFKVLSRYRAASNRTFRDVAIDLGIEDA